MHVRIAWEIYNHQQKQKPAHSSKVPPTSLSKPSEAKPAAPSTPGGSLTPSNKAVATNSPLLRPPNPTGLGATPPRLPMPGQDAAAAAAAAAAFGLMRPPFPPSLYGASPSLGKSKF